MQMKRFYSAAYIKFGLIQIRKFGFHLQENTPLHDYKNQYINGGMYISAVNSNNKSQPTITKRGKI
jgi:hypothetical protein